VRHDFAVVKKYHPLSKEEFAIITLMFIAYYLWTLEKIP
jgi:hypothetical protein